MYPNRTDELQAMVDHLPHGPYAFADKPHEHTARYSISGFEKHDVEQKRLVDAHGAADNLFWYELTRAENRAHQ